jgi:isopentenyl-diphosphate delta-isomerase
MSQVILVDQDDKQLGLLDKDQAHRGKGRLHRALSVFLFNPQGELLIQQRSQNKKLWPGFWANTCCSHPLPDESTQQAAERRLFEELGIRAKLKFHHRFIYRAQYRDVGSEHELCSVFIGVSSARPKPDKKEIIQWQYLPLDELKKAVASHPEQYAPWFKLELKRINSSDILGS